MTDLISIERDCERLVLDSAYYSDRQDYDALAALFTENGMMVRPSGEALEGRAAILRSYQSRPGGRLTRHFCTNIRITVESADRAHGLTYALVYSAIADRPPVAHFGVEVEARHLIGEFEDHFVHTDQGWRIASRSARFVMHTGGH